jgi:hypothetical protein
MRKNLVKCRDLSNREVFIKSVNLARYEESTCGLAVVAHRKHGSLRLRPTACRS